MTYTNNRFRGYIDGKTIWDYSGKLDYNIDKLEDRKTKVSEILNLDETGNSLDLFWQDVWDMGVCKSGLNTTDDLWSDTNVCKCLESIGTYLIAKGDKLPKEDIKVYDDYNLFKRILKEKELVNRYGEKTDDEMIVFRTKKNYKLAPKESINSKDKCNYEEIKNYNDFKQYLLSLTYNGEDVSLQKESKKKREDLVDKINSMSNSEFSMTNASLYRTVRNQLPTLEDDMLYVKNSKERPIKFKAPLRDSGNEIDWSYLDMFDVNHVKALLQVKRDIDVSNEILIDIYDLIEKTDLNDRQKEILDMWRADKTQQYIADELGCSRSVVIKQLDKIVRKIIDTYEKEYEENHYYLNVVKGKYKKCSRCGEIKLQHRFSKNGDRLRSNCKSCTCNG